MNERWAVPNPVTLRVPVPAFGTAVLEPEKYGAEPFRAALIMWGNPVGQGGDAGKSERAMRSLDFVAVADIFMTPTARCADVVLPASTWLERCTIIEGMETGTSSSHLFPELAPRHQIHFSPGALPPRGESLDDFDIVCRLARRMGHGAHFPWQSAREWVEELVGAAREDIRFPWFRDLTVERLAAEGIVELNMPCGVPGWELDLPCGRARIYFDEKADPVPRHIPPEEVPGGDGDRYPLQLICPKTYFRSASTFNNAEKLLRHGFNLATLHPADAVPRGIVDGDRVILFNDRGRIEFRARVSDAIRPGAVHIPAGGEDEQGAANRLTGDGLSEYENAVYNSYGVDIKRG